MNQMNKETIMPLDWYKDYNIKVIQSVKSGEAYSTTGDFTIDEEWSIQKDLKEGYNVIYHNTFGFLLNTTVDMDKLSKCLENIEKLYLLYKLDINPMLSFHFLNFIKPEGQEFKQATEELIEDFSLMDSDEQLKKETAGKDMYYFQRAKWIVYEREPFYDNDNVMKVRARFNFLIRE